ncbi:MAG: alpha/beta hydrolase [Gammaproteobacteria bacterium]|jgi:pimeloyl-ACP methyl ester carboxylesterase|nr:alpha/beta hydrolase [Gammaproteobacteria bacterium]
MNQILPPRFEGTFRLKDGRKLGYAEYGPADGKPILWFHGTPGGRRQIAPKARELAVRRKVRLIAVERPGIGDSTSHSYNSLADWAADIQAFCNAKGIDRFAVCGLSGGGPYALACAYYLQDRVLAATILGGVAPAVGVDAAAGGVSRLTRALAPVVKHLRVPLNALLLRLIRRLEPHVDRSMNAVARFMPPGDQLVFEDPAIRHMFEDDILLASRDQMQAMLHDVVIFGRDWGFELGQVTTPVYLLYGDADNIVPLRHGEHMAGRLPNAELRIREGEGHLGGLGASEEIFDDLLSHWPRGRKSPAKA